MADTQADTKIDEICLAISIEGIVQGVGFRPFVYRLANQLDIKGTVTNAGGSVRVIAQGARSRLQHFVARIESDAPPLAVVQKVRCQEQPPSKNWTGFSIELSSELSSTVRMVPADTAACGDCLAELWNPEDRRHQYPFINCTNCGPRFTIIKSLPYDRSQTTMAVFPMCARCKQEYDDPCSRRFHAQPNACWECGPQIQFFAGCAQPLNERFEANVRSSKPPSSSAQLQAIDNAVRELAAGKIVAIKGLGGFHLACDARNHEAVKRLRQRKHRDTKPFAVMFSDECMLSAYTLATADELQMISSNRRPVVLVDQNSNQSLAPEVSPTTERVGAMLPSTPLQEIILRRFGAPLVMTSGNVSDEPICITNATAIDKLSAIADGFLLHDRQIETRFDDSVVEIRHNGAIFIRRARSYAPESITLPRHRSSAPILALGAHMKNTVCFVQEDRAYVSQHIGDLHSLENEKFVLELISKFEQLFDLKPEGLACDMHPDYTSTKIAETLAASHGLPLVPVQHHHAHIVSCMVEHGLSGTCIGVAFDGTGYGADGSIWGGEILLCDTASYTKLNGLPQFPLGGGDAAAKAPWRSALGLLTEVRKLDSQIATLMSQRIHQRVGQSAVSIVEQQIETRLNCVNTSSCGRLFDAMASLLGICDVSGFDGQAPMQLQSLAETAWKTEARQPQLSSSADILEGIISILTAGAQGIAVEMLSLEFHKLIARATATAVNQAAKRYGINEVCLSGGVFQNRLLSELLTAELVAKDLAVYVNHVTPSNDGGISLGQAIIAAQQMKKLVVK